MSEGNSKNVVAFLGANPNVNPFLLSTEKAFALSGNNTGNYAFWNAVDSHVANEKIYLQGWGFNPHEVREKADVFLIPASNFLHEKRDLGGLAKKIEKTQLPVVIVGLGAQVPQGGELVLKDGTMHFVEVLKDRASFVSVRGEQTASVLYDIGFKDFEVLGCPSNLTNPSQTLGADIEEKLKRLEFGEDCSAIFNFDLHRKKFKKLVVDAIELLDGGYYELVAQNPIGVAKLGRMEIDLQDPHVNFQKDFWEEACPGYKFEDFVKSKFKTFFNAASWMEYVSRFDVSLGTRFHGNMLAFQAGIPALFLAHDSRTSELVDKHALPTSVLTGGEGRGFPCFSGGVYDYQRREDAKDYAKGLCSSGLSLDGSFCDAFGV